VGKGAKGAKEQLKPAWRGGKTSSPMANKKTATSNHNSRALNWMRLTLDPNKKFHRKEDAPDQRSSDSRQRSTTQTDEVSKRNLRKGQGSPVREKGGSVIVSVSKCETESRGILLEVKERANRGEKMALSGHDLKRIDFIEPAPWDREDWGDSISLRSTVSAR